jgi:hypothetical protein
MKRLLTLLCSAVLLLPMLAQAEYRQVNLTVFGMD